MQSFECFQPKVAKRPPSPSTCLVQNIFSIKGHGSNINQVHTTSENNVSDCGSVGSHMKDLCNLYFPIRRSSASNILRNKITFNTNFKFRRTYSIRKNYRKIKENNRSRQSLKIRNSHKDKLCSINCIDINETITKKRKGSTRNDIKFIAGLSDRIYNLIRDKRASDMHGINKINTFIFKRNDDCALCPPSNVLVRSSQSRRSHSTYTSLKKWSKYEPKKKEFQSTSYFEMDSAKVSSKMFPPYPLKIADSSKKTIHVADVPDIKRTKPKTVPLYRIIKKQSLTKKKIKKYVTGTKYRIGSNDAYVGMLQSSSHLNNIVNRKSFDDIYQAHDYLVKLTTKNDRKVEKIVQKQENFINLTARKPIEKNLSVRPNEGVKFDKATQEIVANTLRGVLKPLVETDQEVKTGE